MKASEVEAALKARFVAQWAVSNADVPVFWPNEQPLDEDSNLRTPPVDSDGNASAYLRIDFQFGAQQHAEYGGGLGANTWRQSGEVVIRVLAPSTAGTDVMNALVDDAADALIGYHSGALKVWECAPAGPADETGNYFIKLVIASFFYDRVA